MQLPLYMQRLINTCQSQGLLLKPVSFPLFAAHNLKENVSKTEEMSLFYP